MICPENFFYVRENYNFLGKFFVCPEIFLRRSPPKAKSSQRPCVEDQLGDMDELDKVSIAKDLKADFEEFAEFIADRDLKSSLNQINDALYIKRMQPCALTVQRETNVSKVQSVKLPMLQMRKFTDDKRNSKNF